ncbi:MAG: AraC family transcriptional regulator [Flavobacteriaceae bacterium]|nr:AraC family transcriptional regulator [Flavobacteriaceae bacterium]
MNSIKLPDDLITTTQEVEIFDYFTAKEITKQQVILNRSTFSFLIEGTKEVFFDNSKVTIDNTKFILMKTGHCLMTESLSTTQTYRSILLFISDETITNFILKNNIKQSNTLSNNSLYTFEKDDFITRFTMSLMDINNLHPSIKTKLLQVKLEEILLYLMGIYGSDFIISLMTNHNDHTQKFMRTIESNLLNKLTLTELAFLCGMSLSTFKREFQKHYSQSPIKWFQNKRLEYANRLLQQNNKTASDIYFDIGYDNLSSFIQAYKAKYGVTPKQHNKI